MDRFVTLGQKGGAVLGMKGNRLKDVIRSWTTDADMHPCREDWSVF